MAQRVLFTTLLLCSISLSLFASPTRNNDDSCDISVLPAATLLLPYFEVNLNSPTGAQTLLTITNASPQEQIAHITLWTDYAYPVLDFNVYLTGYDVQAINLFDVIKRGIIAPEFGTGTDVSETGDFSVANERLDLRNCASLPGALPAAFVTRMQQAFTLGRFPAIGSQPACNNIGGTHTNAVGYATIDVVRSCTTRNPSVAGYLTEDILWDNVLLGDYQQIDRANNFAEGGPMVHIRAIAEGGSAADRHNSPGQYEVTFHRTFYSRFLPDSNKTFDARQPLPSIFAARWIQGGAGSFNTSFKIWREGRTTLNAPCEAYVQNVAGFVEAATFDEEENPEGMQSDVVICTPIITYPILPATSLTSAVDPAVVPRVTTGAVAGWVYFNLDNCTRDDYASQNWVMVSMRAEGRFSVDQDAFALGNGCTPPVATSEVNTYPGVAIGPAANINP